MIPICERCQQPVGEGSVADGSVCDRCFLEVLLDPKNSDLADDGSDAELPEAVRAAGADAVYGKFVCTERLGEGAMGVVWKAWDKELSRWVALKAMKGDDPVRLARFARESRIVGKLTHPGIAAVYEIGEARERHFIVMQYVEGETLKDYRGTSPQTIVRFIRDAARAVSFANDHGVIHRDLKPANIMIETTGAGDADRRVYVMDFGLARDTNAPGNISQTGQFIGTPHFMSPEGVRGERGDARTDVYSLGATLYTAVTRRKPFSAPDLTALLNLVLHEQPDSPRLANSRVDQDLEAIMMKCLEKDPAKRYENCHQLADELDRYLAGDAIKAPSFGEISPSAKPRKSPWPAFAAGAAAVFVAAFIIFSSIDRGPEPLTPVMEEALKLRAEVAEKDRDWRGLEAALKELTARTGEKSETRKWADERLRWAVDAGVTRVSFRWPGGRPPPEMYARDPLQARMNDGALKVGSSSAGFLFPFEGGSFRVRIRFVPKKAAASSLGVQLLAPLKKPSLYFRWNRDGEGVFSCGSVIAVKPAREKDPPWTRLEPGKEYELELEHIGGLNRAFLQVTGRDGVVLGPPRTLNFTPGLEKGTYLVGRIARLDLSASGVTILSIELDASSAGKEVSTEPALERAHGAFAAGDLQKARTGYDAALKDAEPAARARILLLRSLLSFREGWKDPAGKDAKDAFQLDPKGIDDLLKNESSLLTPEERAFFRGLKQ